MSFLTISIPCDRVKKDVFFKMFNSFIYFQTFINYSKNYEKITKQIQDITSKFGFFFVHIFSVLVEDIEIVVVVVEVVEAMVVVVEEQIVVLSQVLVVEDIHFEVD